MSKRVKYTVAAILTDRNRPGEFFAVKRPDDDPDLRGEWGFPAVTLMPGELPEDGARRICKEKLNCEAVPKRFLGLMFQHRNSYDIFLMDIEMELISAAQPDVDKAGTEDTQYVDQKWTNDPLVQMPSAKKGSCCSSIFLTDRGLLDRDEWIASLEGSELVT